VAVLEATDPRARVELAALENRFLVANHTGDRLIRRQPADDRTNCHGWVFTGGRYVYRPYRSWYWNHRNYWKPGWRARPWKNRYRRW